MAFQLRAAVAADAAECVQIRGRTRENAVSEERLRQAGITVESWAADIATGALPGFVCEADDGRIAGYCFGASDSGEVVVLALLPEYERRGLGRQLLAMVTQRLHQLGHRRLYLGCSPDPTCRSYGFYRSLGWRSTGAFDAHGDELLEIVADKSDACT